MATKKKMSGGKPFYLGGAVPGGIVSQNNGNAFAATPYELPKQGHTYNGRRSRRQFDRAHPNDGTGISSGFTNDPRSVAPAPAPAATPAPVAATPAPAAIAPQDPRKVMSMSSNTPVTMQSKGGAVKKKMPWHGNNSFMRNKSK